ncbi:MAG: class I SAM-dependent methyltransferase [Alphaproteobacteria bacterium]|nr:class I SAM-dependent methyltransferase [Alphaproteobacteria bacterium]
MAKPQPYARANNAKANLDEIYNAPTPVPYYTRLGELDYVIPHLARPVFGTLIAERAASQAEPVTILDVGCSYGVNGALMRAGLTFDMVRDRYSSPEIRNLPHKTLLEYDRNFFAAWPRRHDVRIIGLDISQPAINYAVQSGAIDIGFAANLETDGLSEAFAKALEKVDIIVSTGCVGYITHRTFDAILAACSPARRVWAASFVLRMFPYEAIAARLATHGLETEKHAGTLFIQRRFENQTEMDATLEALRNQGVDPAHREAAGLFYSELFVSRPKKEIERRPLETLVSVVCGADKPWRPAVNGLQPHTATGMPIRRAS